MGLVTQHSVFFEKELRFSKIYCCGPEPMMKAVANIASNKEVDCEVSLENTMACGFGACLCCIVETVHGNLCVCTEGPVFNTKSLKW
jgi:dihydroorotate dehydrogenase electron transfer subunit